MEEKFVNEARFMTTFQLNEQVKLGQLMQEERLQKLEEDGFWDDMKIWEDMLIVGFRIQELVDYIKRYG